MASNLTFIVPNKNIISKILHQVQYGIKLKRANKFISQQTCQWAGHNQPYEQVISTKRQNPDIQNEQVLN
jgi:hypothetical protein